MTRAVVVGAAGAVPPATPAFAVHSPRPIGPRPRRCPLFSFGFSSNRLGRSRGGDGIETFGGVPQAGDRTGAAERSQGRREAVGSPFHPRACAVASGAGTGSQTLSDTWASSARVMGSTLGHKTATITVSTAWITEEPLVVRPPMGVHASQAVRRHFDLHILPQSPL